MQIVTSQSGSSDWVVVDLVKALKDVVDLSTITFSVKIWTLSWPGEVMQSFSYGRHGTTCLGDLKAS